MLGRFLGGFGVIAFLAFALIGIIAVARLVLNNVGQAGAAAVVPTTTARPPVQPIAMGARPTPPIERQSDLVTVTPYPTPTPSRATATPAPTATPPRPATATLAPTATLRPTATATFVYAPQPTITQDQAYRWCYGWPNCDRSRIVSSYDGVHITSGAPINFTIPPYYRVDAKSCPAYGVQARLENVFAETTFAICAGTITNYDYRPGR